MSFLVEQNVKYRALQEIHHIHSHVMILDTCHLTLVNVFMENKNIRLIYIPGMSISLCPQ